MVLRGYAFALRDTAVLPTQLLVFYALRVNGRVLNQILIVLIVSLASTWPRQPIPKSLTRVLLAGLATLRRQQE